MNGAMTAVAQRTFEDLCFVCADPWPADEPFPPLTAGARVTFEGARTGALELHVEPDALTRLTAFMMGGPGSPVYEQDALGELANVICGNVLPHIAGTTAVCRLGAPVRAPAASARPAATIRLRLDTGAAEVRLFLH